MNSQAIPELIHPAAASTEQWRRSTLSDESPPLSDECTVPDPQDGYDRFFVPVAAIIRDRMAGQHLGLWWALTRSSPG